MKYKDYLEKNHSFDKKTMLGIFCMIIVIGGVFGFLYEYLFYFFNGGMKEFYYRGGNFLPWINIYATGSVMIYILSYKYRKNPLKVFLISVISTGLLEYFSGLGIYIIGDGLRYWDYNTEILNFGNINGFVCLRSVMFFGLSALLLMYVIVPFCFHVASKSNKKVFLIVTISICSIFLADEFYNLIFTRIFNLPNAIKIYKSLGVNYM
jgi:uncharacterized membrane protein